MVLYGIFCYYNTNGDEHLAHKALEVIHGVILTIERIIERKEANHAK